MGNINLRKQLNNSAGNYLIIDTCDYPSLQKHVYLYDDSTADQYIITKKKGVIYGGLSTSNLGYRALTVSQPFMSSEPLPKIYLFGKLAQEHTFVFNVDSDLSTFLSIMEMFYKLRANELIRQNKICFIEVGGVSLYGYVYSINLQLQSNIDSHVTISVSIVGLTECLI